MHRANEVCHLPLTRPFRALHDTAHLSSRLPLPFTCLQALGLVHRANEVCHLLPLSEFYNDAVNNDDFNIKEDFRRYGHLESMTSFEHCNFMKDF